MASPSPSRSCVSSTDCWGPRRRGCLLRREGWLHDSVREALLATRSHALPRATCEQKQPGRRHVWLVGILGTRGRGNLGPASMPPDRRQVHVDGVLFEFRCQLTSRHSTERAPNFLVESHVHSSIIEAKVIGDVVPGDLSLLFVSERGTQRGSKDCGDVVADEGDGVCEQRGLRIAKRGGFARQRGRQSLGTWFDGAPA